MFTAWPVPVNLRSFAPMLNTDPHLHVALTWTEWRRLELFTKQLSVRNREALDRKILPFGV